MRDRWNLLNFIWRRAFFFGMEGGSGVECEVGG